MTTASTVTFGLYLVVVFAIGVFGYFATKTFEDFALGGRGMKDWVVGLSAQASDMSIWLLVGLPATATRWASPQSGLPPASSWERRSTGLSSASGCAATAACSAA